MKRFHKNILSWMSFALIILLLGFIVMAQDEACVDVVNAAIEVAADACEGGGINTVCYGNTQLDADAQSGADITFESVGDVIDITELALLEAAPFDPDTEEWGIAIMTLRARVEGSSPGQSITFLMTGDIALDNASEEDESWVFFLSGGTGQSECAEAPDSFVVQSPAGTRVNLTVNGVEIELGSTAVLYSDPGNSLEILVVAGEAEVTANQSSETIEVGTATSVDLGGADGLSAASAPTAPTTFNPLRTANIPFELLPDAITVSAQSSWTNTGISVQAGQEIFMSVSGYVNTCFDTSNPACDGDSPFNTWHDTLGDDSPCDGGFGPCQLLGANFASLIARVGSGTPFVVGAGGSFIAENDGVLQLGVNDTRFDDNTGAFSVLVTVDGHSAQRAATLTFSNACEVTAPSGINVRLSPSTNSDIRRTTGANEVLSIDRQLVGEDGFTWWGVRNGGWVREDTVNEIGDCSVVPVFN